MDELKFKGKPVEIVDQMYWWLSRSRGFTINNEYRIELLEIDRKRGTVKILITNLKTNSQTVVEESSNGTNTI